MMKWQIDDLKIDIDAVLRGQGADPEIVRKRSPRLIDIAERAIALGIDRLDPQVFIEKYEVTGFSHEKLLLSNGKELKGSLVSGHLAGAISVAVVLCTVGSAIDELAAEIMGEDIVKGLAVDGVGSAAVESLANAVCMKIENDAAAINMETTIPLSPGMIGWDVEEGQSLIFDLVPPSKINIELTPSSMMIPRKSLSMIIGIGPNISSGARICNFCVMSGTCRYQSHFVESIG